MESTTIKALFGRRNIRFVIPAYQRAYAWEKRQFIQFIEDLEECEVCDYYLGHFLFEQDGDTLYVIDGQQRLTTCIIFFRAFINTLKHRETEWMNGKEADTIKNWMDDIDDYYLKDIRHARQKFITVAYDNNFFADTIIDHNINISQEDLTSKSKKSIYNALTYFEEKLSKASIEQLLSWAYSLENASITTYIVKNKLQAAQIFAYQNDRGKRLTNLEVLKAYFMLQIYQSQNNEDDIVYVEKAFEEIYHNIVLVTVEEDNVLNYYWRAVGTKGYYSENVIREVKAWIKAVFPEPFCPYIPKISEWPKFRCLSFEQDNLTRPSATFIKLCKDNSIIRKSYFLSIIITHFPVFVFHIVTFCIEIVNRNKPRT